MHSYKWYQSQTRGGVSRMGVDLVESPKRILYGYGQLQMVSEPAATLKEVDLVAIAVDLGRYKWYQTRNEAVWRFGGGSISIGGRKECRLYITHIYIYIS